MSGTVPARSPSGLFRKATWEGDIAATYERMPRWWAITGERDRHFLEWVAAEARSMAMHLARLVDTDTPPEVAQHARALALHLAEDIAWAERLLGERRGGTGIGRAA